MPLQSKTGGFPLLIEAKSAGDFTNTNKRRKEEATKVAQLRSNYGNAIRFVLFLCGYFDSGYLGYEAAEGIDWVWEHRIDDLSDIAPEVLMGEGRVYGGGLYKLEPGELLNIPADTVLSVLPSMFRSYTEQMKLF